MEGVDLIDPEWVAECMLWRDRILSDPKECPLHDEARSEHDNQE